MRASAWVVIALLAAACASPAPTPSLSPSPSPSPEPTPSPTPSLHVDGLARITTAGLRFRVDPADADPAPRKTYPSPDVGSTVLLVGGPVAVGGVDYWQVYPSTTDYVTPLGWVAAAAPDGTLNLTPFQPNCPPPAGIVAAQIGALDDLEPLVCYGSTELTLVGEVSCSYGIADGFLAGPILSSHKWCILDGALGLLGHPITDLVDTTSTTPGLTGTFEIRGHFDDPGAQHCYGTPFGTSLEGSRDPGDPGAIQHCRTFFVVTSAEALTIQ